MTPEPHSTPPASRRPMQTLLYPLSEFYTHAGLSLPPAAEIDPLDLPEPYRGLLAHQSDMTSTLEKFHRAEIHIQVHGRRVEGDDYLREVVLRLNGSEKPVEFGAICIHLAGLPAPVREQILAEHLPLGRILNDAGLRYSSRPVACLRFASDKLINRLLDLHGAQMLYGRRNTLFDADDKPLAEIVEILPPLKPAAD